MLNSLDRVSNEIYVVYENFGFGFLFNEDNKSYIYSIFVNAGFRVVSVTIFISSKYLSDDVIVIDTIEDTYILRRSHLKECIYTKNRDVVERLKDIKC